ncbi:MAG: hypothetical protein RLP44_16025 [Aggregatilineales bacterium]
MKLRTLKTLLLASLLVFVLAACGGDDNNTTTNTTSPTTETTTSDTSTTTLAQSITSTDAAGGVLTVSYPEGWQAQEFGGSITLGNSAEVFASDAPAIASGQVVGSLLALPTEMLSLLGLGENPTATDVLANMMNTTLTEDPNAQFTVGEPESITVNDKEIVIQTGTATDANGTSDVAFLIVQTGTSFALLSIIAPEGEYATYDAQIRAIAGSVEYTIPQADG